MKVRKPSLAGWCATTLVLAIWGPAACLGQRTAIPSNVSIGREFGGDATDNPIIDTRSKPVAHNARGVYRFPSLGVQLNSNFAGGRISDASLAPDCALIVFIDSENYPINDSPWYCFEISRFGSCAASSIKIHMAYPEETDGDKHKGSHRYRPKLSRDGGQSWTSIDPDLYDHQKAVMTLTLGQCPLLVSAQELETTEHSRRWTEKLAAKPFIKTEVIGKSLLGKDIRMLHIVEQVEEDKPELFVLGRQHPPEVTGTLAMRRFVEYLASDEADAREFRARFNVRVIPMVNPDGVDYGQWRHNMGGVDLNRDWSESIENERVPKFNQPETRIVAAALKRYDTRNVAFAIDFHSTHKDLFYLLSDSLRDRENDVAMNWIIRFALSLPERKMAVHTLSDKLYYSTALAWLNRRFGCPGAVYEVGDETPRDELAMVAQRAAKTLIRELLAAEEPNTPSRKTILPSRKPRQRNSPDFECPA